MVFRTGDLIPVTDEKIPFADAVAELTEWCKGDATKLAAVAIIQREAIARLNRALPDDAAELIDSAQDAAKILAQRCAEKDAENARLREAIRRWSVAVKTTPLKSTQEQETECFQAARDLHEIAREGR